MITLSGVSKAYGERPLFRDASLRLVPGRRIALVGGNGSGKTTLLEIVVGLQDPDQGEVTRGREVRVGYLPQDVDDPGDGTVVEAVLAGAAELRDVEARLRRLEEQMAHETGDPREQLLEVYGREQHRFEHLGGYGIEAEAHRVLAGLGFAPGDASRPVRELSGGWRVRCALARLLLSGPDLLVLDEPTNHLDLESIAWLEATLREHPGAVLFVSHDRDFIDAVAERVVEISGTTVTEYVGGFAEFVDQRDQRLAQQRAAAKQQQREIERTERFIERFRYKDSKARQVQSRVKALDRLQRVEVDEPRAARFRLGFPEPQRSGRVVVELSGVAHVYGDDEVLRDVELSVERGWKVAIVGPNGAGKSTLLRIAMGELPPTRGTSRRGHNVDVSHFAQHQVDALRQDRRVIEEFASALPPSRRGGNIRSLLGAFGFGADAVDREVRALSGGEQTRLALARIMSRSANLLCLDEPTNHLDIGSRDLLEDALVAYPGTVLMITHDRHVIRSVADHVLEVRAGTARLFDGDYESFLDQRLGSTETAAAPAPVAARGSDGGTRERRAEAERRNARYRATRSLRSEVGRVEADLERVEAEVAELTRILADPATYDDNERVKQLVARHGEAKDRAAVLMARWERAQLELERTEAELESAEG